MSDREKDRRAGLVTELRPASELLGLATLAITQPVLDVFGRDLGTFLIRDVGTVQIVVFALVVALLPAALLLGLEVAIGAFGGTRARRLVHLLTCSSLGALGVYGIVRQAVDGSPEAYLVLLLVCEVLVALLWLSVPQVREGARYLSLAAPVFVAMFLLVSDVSALVLPGGDGVSVSSDGSGGGAPVVFIVFDELPTYSLLDGEGRIDASNYPAFARLAADSTWFRNHTTVAPDTLQAVPAVTTGQYPGTAR